MKKIVSKKNLQALQAIELNKQKQKWNNLLFFWDIVAPHVI